jgi:heavy metal sensor kinase
MAPPSIRLRLAAWYGALLMVTIAGLGVAVCMLTARSLLGRVDAALDFEFEEAAERLAGGRSADAPAAFHEAYLLRILLPDGRTLAQSPVLDGLSFPTPDAGGVGGPPGHVSVRLSGLGPCRVVTGAVGTGARRRVVQIAASLAPYEGELAELKGVLWAILPAGLVVATGGGYWLAGRALAPVQRMTETAQRISAANLGDRIEVANPTDELGRLGVTINEMLDRIDRAFAATRRFTADAAHELRTPLASIRAEAEVALLARRSPEDYETALCSVVEEVERLSRLTDRLLLLAQGDSGASLPRRPIRLDDVVRAAVGDAAGTASREGVALRIGGLPRFEVQGDQDLLRQAFDNLLDNAVKYTPAGGVVTVRGCRDGARAVVEVCDTGVGIPPEALPRVFDRFYRVDASRDRRTGGTGLGLSIVKAVVERYDGTVEASSTPGEGSTFRVSLPTGRETQPA